VDGLSPSFSENVGPNELIFHPRGALVVGSAGSGTFGVALTLQTPFFYDAAPGHNLLLDVKNYQGEALDQSPFGTLDLDAQYTLGDGVSSVDANSVGSAFGNVNTGGLITQFTYTPVPEANPSTLFGLGVIGYVLSRCRRDKNLLLKRDQKEVPCR
jgi:hypothetical protein